MKRYFLALLILFLTATLSFAAGVDGVVNPAVVDGVDTPDSVDGVSGLAAAAPAGGCSGTMDFTDVEWVETDSGGDIAKTDSNTVTVDTILGSADSNVSYNCGSGALNPLSINHDIDVLITASTGAVAIVGVWGISDDSTPTYNDMDTANDGIILYYYDAAATGKTFVFKDLTNNDLDQVEWATGITTLTQYYMKIVTNGSDLEARIYTNANRTDGHVDTLVITPGATTYDYVSVVLSLDQAFSETVSAVIENLVIN